MESKSKPVEGEVVQEISLEHDSENYVLELQPAERGLKSQLLEADLVLWTVGSKPLLPQLEPCERPHEIPLNARGQAETDETLRVKGHPRIFALGDSSALRDSKGRILPATAQVFKYLFFLFKIKHFVYLRMEFSGSAYQFMSHLIIFPRA